MGGKRKHNEICILNQKNRTAQDTKSLQAIKENKIQTLRVQKLKKKK